ncbi:MAG: diguanylate cyclase [Deltaproteobacteria bacterium]|nr:diguanylate cyclase [Deltaproteobacteria bacterium]
MTVHTMHMLVGFVANALLGFFILSRDPKATANRTYAWFTFCVAWWAIVKFVLAFSPDAEQASFWYKLSGPGWIFLPAVYLHFVAAFTRRRLFGRWSLRIHQATYALAGLLSALAWADGLIVDHMIPSTWGFTHVPGALYSYVFTPYLLTVFVFGLCHLIAYTARAVTRDDRIRGGLLIAGIVIPLVGGTATNMILPVFGRHVPELAIPLTTVNATIVAVAIVKYNLLSITVEYAASTIITTMPDALVVLDQGGGITLVNPATITLTGYDSKDLVGRSINDVCRERCFDRDLRDKLDAQGVAKMEIHFVTKERAAVPVSISISPLKDRRGATVGYVCVAKDIRDIKALIAKIEDAKQELEKIAITDPLTGVYNRRFLSLRLKEEFLRGLRYGAPFSVVAVDLDRFKEINDNLGHSVGDKLLKDVGTVFRETLRSSDVVTRYGGDEFVLILPETSGPTAVDVSTRLRERIEALRVDGSQYTISASFGVSTFNPARSPDSEEMLLRWADNALYESKRLGRNRVTHCDAAGGATTPETA